jgi:hypothetical protein
MTMMYSPIGGWVNAIGSELEDLKSKGWFAEGTEGYLDPSSIKKSQPLVKQEKTGIVEEQPAVVRVGRPRRGSQPT